MLNKIIYYLRIFSFLIYMIISILLLPFVLKCEKIGIFFLVTLFLFIAITLFSMFSKKDIYIKTKSYNLVIIALSIYIAIVYSRTLLDERLTLSGLYTINLNYCKMNFILLGLVMIGITLNTVVLYLMDEGDKK